MRKGGPTHLEAYSKVQFDMLHLLMASVLISITLGTKATQ